MALLVPTSELAQRLEAGAAADRILWATQKQVPDDVVKDLLAGNEFGYVKRPTGTGKTTLASQELIAFNTNPSQSSPSWDYPVMIVAPRRLLTEQFVETLTDKDKFGLDPSLIGIYHSQIPNDQRKEALKRPILITTYASMMSLVRQEKITAKDRPIIIGDEIHRARGDVIRPFIQDTFFGNSYFQGWTATDLFMTGQTIGDYLFRGREPMHVTDFQTAVLNGEISPFKNIVWNSPVVSDVKVPPGRDYTEMERQQIVSQAGRDEFAIRQHATYRDPETGLYLRDMDSIWYCAGITHADHVAKSICEVFGEGYAVAVSGQTDPSRLRDIIAEYKDPSGRIKAIANAMLLVEGFDARNAQAVYMLAPYRDPIIVEQTGGRAMRKDPRNPNKLTYIITLLDSNMPDMAIFGHLAGGYFVAPEGARFSSGKNKPSNEPSIPGDWPKLDGVEVYSTVSEIIDFTKKRETAQAPAPPKTDDWFQQTEFAAQVGISPSHSGFRNIVIRLRQTWEVRQSNGTLTTNPLMLGNIPIKAEERLSGTKRVFCFHRDDAEAFKQKLGLDASEITDEWYTKSELRRVVGAANKKEIRAKFESIWERIEREYASKKVLKTLDSDPIMLNGTQIKVEQKQDPQVKGNHRVQLCVHEDAISVFLAELGTEDQRPVWAKQQEEAKWHHKKLIGNAMRLPENDSVLKLLLARLGKEFDRRVEDGSFATNPIILMGKSIEICAAPSGFKIRESAFDALRKERERLIAEYTKGWFSKGEVTAAIQVDEVHKHIFAKMWDAIETAAIPLSRQELTPGTVIAREFSLPIINVMYAVGTRGWGEKILVDQAAVELIIVNYQAAVAAFDEARRNEQKTADWLNKSELAQALGSSTKDPDFESLFRNFRFPWETYTVYRISVGGTSVRFANKNNTPSGKPFEECVHRDGLDALNVELGNIAAKRREKEDEDITWLIKSILPGKLHTTAYNPVFVKLFDDIRAAYSSAQNTGNEERTFTIDGREMRAKYVGKTRSLKLHADSFSAFEVIFNERSKKDKSQDWTERSDDSGPGSLPPHR